jgi:Na+-transporting methylmalonyl-CoA/oxaloacetate decarboxylase gamma subunit
MSDLAFGLTITAAGMGLVFGLLALLWGALALLGRLDGWLPAEDAGEAPPPSASATAPAGDGAAVVVDGHDLDDDALAAIALAVGTHAALLRMQAAPEQRATQPGSQIYASRWLAAGRTRQTRVYARRR